MTLAAGARLGSYEIVGPLGVGGMGEVYRARDTKLNRDVALKVLPDSFATDVERLARFKREAQLLALLNHPNIAAIYGHEDSDGMQALVLELVEGPTLADRIARGPLPLDEALPIAKQIAEALEAAHEQGIIHRDLKPANIKLRPDGTVKVLDFGLARALAPKAGAASVTGLTFSPTITSPAMTRLRLGYGEAGTEVGTILGTAAYMSPEQAKGREADKRSDVWAFGAVLYEMITGQRAFDGDDMTDVLGAVVRLEPKWEALPADLSPALRTLIQRCLVKDRKQRVSDISAVKFVLMELQNLVAPHVLATPAAAPRPRWRRAVPAAVAATLAALLGAAVTWTLRPSPTPPVVAQFSVPLPDGQSFSNARQIVAVSADGTRLAYVANFRIYIRSISDPEPHAVPRTDAESNSLTLPMFAPDGQSIAFYEGRTLKRIPLIGGAATTIANIESSPCGASWGLDGLVFANVQGGRNGIWRVSPTGGAPELLVEFPNDEAPCSPHLLPGGRAVLFTLNKIGTVGLEARADFGQWDKAQIVAQSLADKTRHVLMEGADARYLSTGHLLYSIAGTMHAVPFDADRISLTGGPVSVIQGVTRSLGEATSATQAAVSESGTLVYLPGPATTTATTFSLLVGDERSDPVRLDVPAGALEHPRVSPDGRTLAVGRNDGGRSDIWIYDLSGRTAPRQLTIGGHNRYPIWSSDGRRVTFQSGRESDEAIFSQSVDAAVRVTTPAKGEMHVPEAWSPDGRYLLYSAGKAFTLRMSLQALRVDDGTPTRLATGLPGPVRGAAFSPDGRWVAYSSGGAEQVPQANESVFVEPFPPTGQRIPAPKERTLRDFHPVWARDGQRLLYSRFPQRLVAVPFSAQPPAFGLPVEFTRTPRTGIAPREARGYDVLPDGRVVSVSPLIGSSPASPQGEIRVVLNWLEELKRLVPTK